MAKETLYRNGVDGTEPLYPLTTSDQVNVSEGVQLDAELEAIHGHYPQMLTATLTVAGWSAAAPYTQTVSVTDLLESDTPIADVVLSDTVATAKAQLEAYGMLGRLTCGAGTITAICYEEKPTTELVLALKVVR